MARRVDSTGADLPPMDDKWILSLTSNQGLNLYSSRIQQNVRLGFDHVREYMTDIGDSAGFLLLKSQIVTFAPRGASVEPLAYRA